MSPHRARTGVVGAGHEGGQGIDLLEIRLATSFEENPYK